jgi:hypothetical protein
MRRTSAFLVLALCCAPACGSDVAPSLPPPTRESFATSLAGTYTLTIRLDDRCSSLAKAVWKYRAVLSNGGGGYLSVQVLGDGYSEPTVVGQIYTYTDSTARYIWNFAYPETPIAGTQLLLYGSGDTAIRNGSLTGTIAGDASTTRDGNVRCSGSHAFTFDLLSRENLNTE